MQLHQQINIVKQHLRAREKAILDRGFKAVIYVPVRPTSVIARTLGPKISEVEVGLDRVGQEWHVCVSYYERVRDKQLRRIYSVENMSQIALLDTINMITELEQVIDERRMELEQLYFEAASYVLRMENQ